MGLSSTAARLLQLTSRKNTIGYELARLSNDKLCLTREMRKVSREYNEAINTKVLKWSNNSGVTYEDLSYKSLMQPGVLNSCFGDKTAYLLTDLDGKIVLDDRYKDYAMRISPDGSAGGDWLSNRTAILSELTGIDAAKIDGVGQLHSEIEQTKATLDNVKSRKPSTDSFRSQDFCCLLEKMGSRTGASNGANIQGADDWADAYQHANGTINLGPANKAPDVLKSICDNLKDTLSGYLIPEESIMDPDAVSPFIEACDNFYKTYSASIEGDWNDGSLVVSKDNDGNIILDMNAMLNTIMEMEYKGEKKDKGDGSHYYTWYDKDSLAFSNYKSEYFSWEAEYNEALQNYNNATAQSGSLLTATEESLINFYDNLFGAIADKGWSYNENVNDNDYLNQMLQNNLFTITTVDRNDNGKGYSEDYYEKAVYNTEIAINLTNIVPVNDNDARQEAYTEYEEKKAIINAKETRIDLRMQDLQVEQESINTMLQGMKTIMDDNIERFNVFT